MVDGRLPRRCCRRPPQQPPPATETVTETAIDTLLQIGVDEEMIQADGCFASIELSPNASTKSGRLCARPQGASSQQLRRCLALVSHYDF